jgi:hypothetical protein
MCVFWQHQNDVEVAATAKYFLWAWSKVRFCLLMARLAVHSCHLNLFEPRARSREKIKTPCGRNGKRQKAAARDFTSSCLLCAFRPAMLCERRACVLYNLRQRAPAAVDLWIINRVALARLLIKREETFELFVLLSATGASLKCFSFQKRAN